MHALFFLKHSRAGDEELRFALRSVARNCPFIEKVWVFGDRPHFLADDTQRIEHVAHDLFARAGKVKTPVTNFFLLTWLSSLIPGLSPEYLRFSDDTLVVDTLSIDDARKARYLENLDENPQRGGGLWKDSLWRTYDTLKRLGYTGYNFETHCPTHYTKERVLRAYADLQDYVTEDRWYGLLGPTAILNHAYRREQFPLTKLADEARNIGFHFQTFAYEEIAAKCEHKTFLNFDDIAFDANLRRYLHDLFPEPCHFERHEPSHWSSVTLDPTPVATSNVERKTVLFALELGGGWGHLGVVQPLARQLIEQGHRVVVATPQLATAMKLLADLPIELLASPALGSGGSNSPPRTFAQVLQRTCFRSATETAARCAAWQAIFAMTKPDAIVCDHAPTALLAARTTTAARIPLGQGFTLPDVVEHFPDWRRNMGGSQVEWLADEQRALDTINGWLASQRAELLARLSDLYHDVDAQLLATLPQLDCYAPRRQSDARYLGIWPVGGGCAPPWPEQEGKKVLAYVKSFKTLPVLLEQLRRLKAATIVVGQNLDAEVVRACEGTRVRVLADPVDLPLAARECDLAIGHGTHGFTAAMLVAGKPQLMLPLVLEQRLNAEGVQKRGAGEIADSRQAKDVILKLRRIWEQPHYAAHAAEQIPATALPKDAAIAAEIILTACARQQKGGT